MMDFKEGTGAFFGAASSSFGGGFSSVLGKGGYSEVGGTASSSGDGGSSSGANAVGEAEPWRERLQAGPTAALKGLKTMGYGV